MAFCANFVSCFVLVVVLDAPPVLRMGVGPASLGTVALDADIAFRVTCLA